MTVDFRGLDIYFHMSNHYRKLKKVRSLIDCSPPKGYDKIDSNRSSLSKGTSLKSRTSSSSSRASYRSNVSHLPIHSSNLKRHDCVNEQDAKSPSWNNAGKERASSVPPKKNTTYQPNEKAGERPKSVEPLVKRVPFSRFNPQPKNDDIKKSKTSKPLNNNSGDNSGNQREGSLSGSNNGNSETSSTSSGNKNKSRNKPDKTSGLKSPKNPEEHEYLQFLLRITEDILRNDLYTNVEMQKVFESHKRANQNRLNVHKMDEHINSLKKELNFPSGASRPRKLDLGMCGCNPDRKELMKALMKCECGPDSSDQSQDCSKCAVGIEPTETQMEVEIGGQQYETTSDRKSKKSNSKPGSDVDSEKSSLQNSPRGVNPPKTNKSTNRPNTASPTSPRTERNYNESDKAVESPRKTNKILESSTKNKSPTVYRRNGGDASKKSSVSSFGDDLPGFDDIEPSYTPKSAPKPKILPAKPVESNKAQPQTKSNMSKPTDKKEATNPKPPNLKQIAVTNSDKPSQNDRALERTDSRHLSEKAPEIVFHVGPGEECHCKISFRKMALKIRNDEANCEPYVLVEGPVCIPKSLLEDRCVPVLLETSSSIGFDSERNIPILNNRDSVANNYYNENEDDIACSRNTGEDGVCEDSEVRSFSDVDIMSTMSAGGSLMNKAKYRKNKSSESQEQQRKNSQQRRSITISSSTDTRDAKSKGKEVVPRSSAKGVKRKDEMKKDLLLNNDYDLTPQRDVSVGDSNGNQKYHFLMVDKSTSMTQPLPMARMLNMNFSTPPTIPLSLQKINLVPIMEPDIGHGEIIRGVQDDRKVLGEKQSVGTAGQPESLFNTEFTDDSYDSNSIEISSVTSSDVTGGSAKRSATESVPQSDAIMINSSLFETKRPREIDGQSILTALDELSITSGDPSVGSRKDSVGPLPSSGSEGPAPLPIFNTERDEGPPPSFKPPEIEHVGPIPTFKSEIERADPAPSFRFENEPVEPKPSVRSENVVPTPSFRSTVEHIGPTESSRSRFKNELIAPPASSKFKSDLIGPTPSSRSKNESLGPAPSPRSKNDSLGPKASSRSKNESLGPTASSRSRNESLVPPQSLEGTLPTSQMFQPHESFDATGSTQTAAVSGQGVRAGSGASLEKFLDAVQKEEEVELTASDVQSLKDPPDTRSLGRPMSVSNLSNVSDVQEVFAEDPQYRSDARELKSVSTNETQGFQTGGAPVAPTVHTFRSPNASEREHFVFQPHPSEDKLTPDASPLEFLKDDDFMAKLDREPSTEITKDHAKRIAEVTGKLKKFRNVAQEDDNSSVRHQYRSNVAPRMSLVSTNTQLSDAEKLARFNPNFSDQNVSTNCCGLGKNKGKKKGSLTSSNSDVSASYPTRNR